MPLNPPSKAMTRMMRRIVPSDIVFFPYLQSTANACCLATPNVSSGPGRAVGKRQILLRLPVVTRAFSGVIDMDQPARECGRGRMCNLRSLIWIKAIQRNKGLLKARGSSGVLPGVAISFNLLLLTRLA